ncbi:hypothetical protein C6P78_13530 [Burkholderia multivorans]|nr:hypothetical protein C6P78_13530 [Burkholderia multivorans]
MWIINKECSFEDAKRLIEGANVVSFDVFDTLIHRIVARPADVFDLVAAKLRHHDDAAFASELIDSFPVNRFMAEIQAREKKYGLSNSYEVTYEEIYAELAVQLGGDGRLIDRFKAAELEVERDVVRCNPIMLQLVQYARALGKPVVLCSDMYLPSDAIRELLASCGYPELQLVVSCEAGASKHEGTLFSFAAEKVGQTTCGMVHFGDNLHADVNMAQLAGVKGVHFDYLQRIEMDFLRDTGFPADAIPRTSSLILGGTRTALMEAMNKQKDPWYDVGLQVFGPLFLGYFIWMMHQLKLDRVEKILFLARDGYFFYQLYRQYAEQMGVAVPSEYVYVSRAATLLPSFVDFPPDRVWHLFGGRTERTVRQHFSRLGLDVARNRALIKAVGFQSENDRVPNGDMRMHRLISMLLAQLMDVAAERRSLVSEYLSGLVSGCKRIGVSDIGWGGNMQGGLSRILQTSRSDFRTFGYYFGTFDSVRINQLPGDSYFGYLVENSEPRYETELLHTGGVEILEFATVAPHGTTLGYHREMNEIVPILEDNNEDVIVQSHAAVLQAGARQYIDSVLPTVIALGYEHFISSEWGKPFFRLVARPTKAEAALLGALTHSDSAGDTSLRLRLAEKVTADGSQHSEQVAASRARAFWKAGFDVLNSTA